MKEIFDCIIKDSESHLSYLAFSFKEEQGC